MAWVQTTTGAIVAGWDKGLPEGAYTLKQAETSAKERNERATELGIQTRYVAAE